MEEKTEKQKKIKQPVALSTMIPIPVYRVLVSILIGSLCAIIWPSHGKPMVTVRDLLIPVALLMAYNIMVLIKLSIKLNNIKRKYQEQWTVKEKAVFHFLWDNARIFWASQLTAMQFMAAALFFSSAGKEFSSLKTLWLCLAVIALVNVANDSFLMIRRYGFLKYLPRIGNA